MPNTRRRRFSVQKGICARNKTRVHNGTQVSKEADSEINTLVQNNGIKCGDNKHSNNSKSNEKTEIIAVRGGVTPVATLKEILITKIDKDVTASSSNIDLFNILKHTSLGKLDPLETNNPKDSITNRDKYPIKRDSHQRQHRAKVRSPRRRLQIQELNQHIYNIRSVGTNTILWNRELELHDMECIVHENVEVNEDDIVRPSNNSLVDMCRICHGGETLTSELGQLISACSCRGTVGRVHVKCLERWLTESGKSRCELCGTRYATRRVHRYGMPRALIMWILSQNAKQLMVDSLGIMLMSPLAVLAAWLSGRTLAGLMAQESHFTPWPLASTFVLACMTLVCYYCWIVSAATRHALGWWIWYRSQYEVRLELQDQE